VANPLVGVADFQFAKLLLQQLCPPQNDPEPGAADIVELREVEDDTLVVALDDVDKPIACVTR